MSYVDSVMLQEYTTKLGNKLKTLFSSPLTAAAAADMLDTTKVYVFTGTTTSSLTNGHWYYYNGSAWADGGVYNAVAVNTDKTLTAEDQAADAQVVGMRLRALFDGTYRQGTNASLWQHGTIKSDTGENSSVASTSPRMRTITFLNGKIKGVKPAPGYKVIVYVYDDEGTYQGIWNGTSLGTGASAVHAFTSEVVLPYSELGYKYRIVAGDINDTNLDTEEKQAIVAGAIYFAYYTDTTMSVSGQAADAGAVGDLFDATLTYRRTLTDEDDMDTVDLPGTYYYSTVSAGGGAPAHAPTKSNHRYRAMIIKPAAADSFTGGVQIVWRDDGEMKFRVYAGSGSSGSWEEDWHTVITAEEVVDRLTVLTDAAFEQIDTTNYSYGFGGTHSWGALNPSQKHRLYFKLRGYNGKWWSAYSVRQGSTITAAEGVKFGVAMYSEYHGTDKYKFIGMRSITLGGGSYTIPQDCFIRVTVGLTNDPDLWTANSDGDKILTSEGTQALNGITFDLYGAAVSETVQQLRAQVEEMSTGGRDFSRPLNGGIPVNAVEYHKQWDDLVSNGACTRSAAFYPVSGDEVAGQRKWPIYTYTIKSHTKYMNKSYIPTARSAEYPQLARPKILITSGVHGSEKATPNCLMDFVRTMCSESEYAALLCKYDWTIVPLVNPWGYSHSYVSAGGTVYHGMYWDPPASEKSKAGISGNVTLQENTVENGYNGGVRHTSTGIDMNRSFTETNYTYTDVHNGYTSQHSSDKETTVGGDPQTDWTERPAGASTGGYGWLPEARYLWNVLTSQKFDIMIDLHQAGGVDYNDISGFVSGSGTKVSSQKSMDLKPLWDAVTQSGADTEAVLCNKFGVPFGNQTYYPWETMAGYTWRAYAGGGDGNIANRIYAVKYALVLETSCACVHYSGSSARSMWQNDISNEASNTFVHNFLRRFLEEVEV